MAEKDTKEEATTPEPEFGAAEALKALESEETEESKGVTADEDKTEDKTEDDDKEEDSQELDNEDDEDNDLDLESKLKLDPAIADKLPAEVVERFGQQVKGLAKKEKQFAEREEALQADEKGFQTYQGLSRELFESGPEKAQAVLEHLTKVVHEHHKLEAKESKEEPTTDDTGVIHYDGKEFYSQTDLETYQELQATKAELAALREHKDPELEEIKAERKAEKEQKALNSWVDSNSKSLIAKIAVKTGGWGITKEQIAEVAKTDRAALEADPVKVMKRHFPDEWGEFRATGSRKFEVKDMIDNSQAKGMKIPDNPDEYGAAHALMELSQ